MQARPLFLLSLLALAAFARPAHAAQSYDACTGYVTSLPTTIGTPGTWCLKQDLATSVTNGRAITITADHVTLDCNDFMIDGSAGGVGSFTQGVYVYQQSHVAVRHCHIRGFTHGVQFFAYSSGGQYTVEDNLFDHNYLTGANVQGPQSIVRRNRILDTGGTTLPGAGGEAFGILVYGTSDVLDNEVSGVKTTAGSTGYPYGIFADTDTNASIRHNDVRGVVATGTGIATAIGIGGASNHLALRDNVLAGNGAATDEAVFCANEPSNRVKDNIVHGFGTGLQFCTDAGGNDVTP